MSPWLSWGVGLVNVLTIMSETSCTHANNGSFFVFLALERSTDYKFCLVIREQMIYTNLTHFHELTHFYPPVHADTHHRHWKATPNSNRKIFWSLLRSLYSINAQLITIARLRTDEFLEFLFWRVLVSFWPLVLSCPWIKLVLNYRLNDRPKCHDIAQGMNSHVNICCDVACLPPTRSGRDFNLKSSPASISSQERFRVERNKRLLLRSAVMPKAEWSGEIKPFDEVDPVFIPEIWFISLSFEKPGKRGRLCCSKGWKSFCSCWH